MDDLGVNNLSAKCGDTLTNRINTIIPIANCQDYLNFEKLVKSSRDRRRNTDTIVVKKTSEQNPSCRTVDDHK